MNTGELIEYRRRLGFTQAQMAEAMRIGSRSYFDIEGQDQDKEVSKRHLALLERFSLTIAVERRDLGLALPAVRRDARAYMDLFEGRPLERIFQSVG